MMEPAYVTAQHVSGLVRQYSGPAKVCVDDGCSASTEEGSEDGSDQADELKTCSAVHCQQRDIGIVLNDLNSSCLSS